MNAVASLTLSPEHFAAAFPFHVAFDPNMVVRQVGGSLTRLCPTLSPGSQFNDQIQITYPAAAVNYDAIRQNPGMLFILELPAQAVRLRGQMVHVAEQNVIIFLGSPWITEPSEMKRLGLTFTDFALHDPVADLLQVMQSQAMVLADTCKLADRLATQRTELRTANAALKAEMAERLAAEMELREREDRFQTLLEAASEAIVIVDDTGCIVLVNASAEALFGYPRDALVGQPVEVLLPDNWAGLHKQHRTGYMMNPHTRPMGGGLTLTGRRKDGSHLPLEISLSSIKTQSGTLVMSFITDITERRRTAEELQSQRDFALQVMSNMGQGLTVTDSSGKYEYVNQAFAQLLGYAPNLLIGRAANEFILPDDRDRFAHTHTLLREGRTNNQEVRLRHAGGEPVHVLFTCVPRMRDGRFLGSITVVTNMAERKQIEQALEWARDRALEASRLKSDFLANMSHEIRTPLNSIIGVAEMLGSTPLDHEQREFAHIIHESGNALLALINDILDFSKIEAGRLDIERRPFDLRRCIESALDVLAPKAYEKDLELAYLIEEPAPHTIVGDETRLRQILLNLLGNAVKFTQRGEVTLTVNAHPLTTADHTIELHFAIHDSGVGIPVEGQAHLFESFSQVDTSTTRKYGGTGLGLAISRRLCDAMGGRMWVESLGIAGKGASFFFTLPTREPLADTPAQMGATHALPVSHRALQDKHMVLVLGTHGTATQWRSLTLQAQTWGMDVRFCTQIDELAAWRAAGKRVDVAVIDEQLLNTADGLTNAIVPSMTGLPWLVLAPVGQYSPADGVTIASYLSKPVKSTQWQKALVQAVGGAHPLVRSAESAVNLFDKEFARRIPLRILVVEDNPVNQIVIQRILERLGYRAAIAANGTVALATMRNEPYDMVLMDMQMPDMDGLETTRHIRESERQANPERPPVMIIALTANAQSGDRDACLAAGMNDYLSKPIQVAELRHAIERSAAVHKPDQAITASAW